MTAMETAAAATRRVLRPTRGWVPIDFRELVRFKDLLFQLAARDVKLRYKQTLLGVAWVVLQPVLAAGLLSFAFGFVAGLKTERTPYFLFSFVGLAAWNLFAWTLSKTSSSMVGNAYLVSKVYFPRLILPLSATLSTLLDFGVSMAVMVVLMVIYGVKPGLALLVLPIWACLLLCMSLGIGFIAAALTVDYRDVQYILPSLITFMLYASPVAYPASHLAVPYQRVFFIVNPIAGLIEGFRWSVLHTTPPPLPYVAWSASVAVVLFTFGAAVFRRTERKVADVI
jgi:homopolymeric O-antigen transport system permease protein